MKSIRIQNLKSIVDSGNIELNNMTVVIGKNSSGKSTLLRVFPLLKQSMTKRLSSPILWYGDYVDFGSFQKAITNGVNNDGVITFHFVIDDFCVFTEPDKYSYKDVELTLSLNDKDIVYYQFDISGYGKISFKLVNGLYKLFFNDTPIDNIVYVPSLSNSFFPVRKRNDSSEGIYRYLNYYPIDEEYLMLEENHPFSSYYVFKSNLELLFSNDKLKQLVDKLHRRYKNHHTDKAKVPTKEELGAKYIGIIIDEFISHIERSFTRTFKNVQYFEPLRSRGDRFYRVQGLNVDEVDSNGNNAPMILYKMSGKEKTNFQKWCINNLGFYYDTIGIGNGDESTSVVVRCDKNSDNYNMTDVGFGYSQIFPIILSIWMSLFSSETSGSNKTIVIEQPELHLHPAFQKKIIKTFLQLIELSKTKKKDLKFVIETHSETIVNYLGYLISEKSLAKENVNLLVCKKENNESVFEKKIFNDEGYIDNWPVGFFSEEE